MTRPEIQAKIKVQKDLIDIYASQVDTVIAVSIENDEAKAAANRINVELCNRCIDLAKTMKDLGMTSANVKQFVSRDALFHIEQELNRK